MGQTGSINVKEATESIRFYLYSDRKFVCTHSQLDDGNIESFTSTNFNTNYPITLLLHGYNNTYEGSFLQDTKNALLRQNVPTNVVFVDYKKVSRAGLSNFVSMCELVPGIAERIADFLSFLISSHLTSNVSNVHLVGESLGAHICGYVGKIMDKRTGRKIGRITGLDPAGPMFQSCDESERLCPSDSLFVDIVHSNSGHLGWVGTLGHVDFYLNGGGPIQPKYKNDTDPGWVGLDRDDKCHAFATELFTESILKKEYFGCGCFDGTKKCSSCSCPKSALFGYYTPPTTRGDYYVKAYDD